MSEFCAGVKILLERMKSDPEDFELIDSDPLRSTYVRGRFYDFANSMERVIFGTEEKPWGDWQYFTEEERQALVAGFKEMKRVKFDKGIVERVFDERYIERQREEMQLADQPQFYSLKAPQMSQQSMMQVARGGTGFSSGGLVNALGLGGLFK